jgi:hypothetical protein
LAGLAAWDNASFIVAAGGAAGRAACEVWMGGTDAAPILRVELAAGVKNAACPLNGFFVLGDPRTFVSVALRAGGSAGGTIRAPQCTQKRASS